MIPTINAPQDIKDSLYEGQLEIMSSPMSETTRAGGNIVTRSQPGPAVSVGQPQYWNLTSLIKKKRAPLPAEIGLLLRGADFYLLQLACSFRPERDNEVRWARLNVQLQPKTGEEVPIAFDLYPREIYEETKQDWKVSIAPSLSFATAEGSKVEAQLGEAATTIHYRKLEPIVIGYGLLQSNPGWEFQKHKDKPLLGIKVGYLIVKKPHGAEAVLLTQDLEAEVRTPDGWLLAGVKKDHQDVLTSLVCID